MWCLLWFLDFDEWLVASMCGFGWRNDRSVEKFGAHEIKRRRTCSHSISVYTLADVTTGATTYQTQHWPFFQRSHHLQGAQRFVRQIPLRFQFSFYNLHSTYIIKCLHATLEKKNKRKNYHRWIVPILLTFFITCGWFIRLLFGGKLTNGDTYTHRTRIRKEMKSINMT